MALTQAHYRFGIDSGTESTHGWHANEDTDPATGVIQTDTTFLLRFAIFADAAAGANTAPQFEYNRNGGGWNAITTSSSVARAVAATAFANADSTTRRLTTQGTTDAANQGCTTDGLAGGAQMDIPANGSNETECSLQVRSVDVAAGDTIQFRVTNGGTVFTTYSVTPTFTVPTPLTPATPPSESSKVVDTVTAVLVTLLLTAGPTDAAKIGTSGSVGLQGLGNPIRVVDGPPSAQLVGAGGDLSRQIADEVVKVADSVSVSRTLEPTLLTESLKVVDALTAEIGISVAVSAESIKSDEGGRVDIFELTNNPIHVVDGPVVAALSGDDLTRQVVDEIIKITDTTLVTLDPEQTGPGESLKVGDAPTTTLDPEQAGPVEALKVVDTILGPTLDPEQVSLSESLKVVDDVLTTLDPLQALSTEDLKVVDQTPPNVVRVDAGVLTPSPEPGESLKVVDVVQVAITFTEVLRLDEGGFVGLLGLGNPVRVVDGPPTAALIGNDLNVEVISEALKVVDTVSVTIDPEVTSISEGLKVVDTVSAAVIAAGSLAANLSEALKVVDTAQTLLDPEQATPTEPVKADEGGRVDIFGPGNPIKVREKLFQVLLTDPAQRYAWLENENLKISDQVSAAFVGDLSVQVTTENVKAVDQVSASLGAGLSVQVSTENIKISDAASGFIGIQANLSENIKVSEGGEVQLGRDEIVRVSDQVTAGLGGAVSLNENLKISDSALTIFIDPEQTTPQEILRLADTVSANLGDDLATIINEIFKISDIIVGRIDPEQTSLNEIVKISDFLSASLGSGTSLTESLKVSDVLIVSITPEFAVITDESLSIVDQIFAALVIFDLSGQISENVKVADSTTVVRDHGVLHAGETIKVADTLTAIMQWGVQVANENVKVTDTPNTLLNPLQATPAENVKVQDQISVASGTTLLAVAGESFKVADTLTQTLDPEETTLTESAKVTDTLTVVLNPEQTEVGESVRCADSVQVVLDPLNVIVTESLEVVEESLRFGGPRVIDIVGSYSTSVADLSGFVASTMDITGNYPAE